MRINVNINDSRSIKKAISQIEKYKQTFRRKTKDFVERVGKLGVETLNAKMSFYDIPSYIKNSIELKNGDAIVNGSKVVLIVNDKVAMFWEFGTGSVGASSPHPAPTWKYNINNHEYWVYTARQGELTHWSWEIKDGVYQTKGMKAQPFMYETLQELSNGKWNEICNIAKEVFNEELE